MTDRRRDLLLFAALGVISGAITTGALFALPQDWRFKIGNFLILSPASILAGLVFGIIFGAFLKYRGLADVRTVVLYALASTASYFVAVHLLVHGAYSTEDIWKIGMFCGLAGSACLTAAAVALLPFARRVEPIALMLIAGCLLGALLDFALADGWNFWRSLVFFALWQAGYAAAFATALPGRGPAAASL